MRPGKRLGWSIRTCTSESSLSSAESFTSPLDLPLWGGFRRFGNLPQATDPFRPCRRFWAGWELTKTWVFMTMKTYSLRMADILAMSFDRKENFSRCRYVLTKGNFICCSECCSIFRERFALNDSWEIKTDCLNTSDKFLRCDSCDKRIPVAKRSK